MWGLLEARLRPEALRFPSILLISGVTSVALAWRLPNLRSTPEHFALTLGISMMVVHWLFRQTTLAAEGRERRVSLLVRLPVTVRQVGWVRLLEPVAPVLAVSLIAGLVGIVGRWIEGGEPHWIPLQGLLVFTAFSLAMDQLQLLSIEVLLRRFDPTSRPWLVLGVLSVGLLILSVVLGLVFGGLGDPLRELLHQLDVVKLVLGFVGLAALVAQLNHWFFTHRPDFTR